VKEAIYKAVYYYLENYKDIKEDQIE